MKLVPRILTDLWPSVSDFHPLLILFLLDVVLSGEHCCLFGCDVVAFVHSVLRLL